MFGSFLPSLLVGLAPPIYPGTGADIVMESITSLTRSWPNGLFRSSHPAEANCGNICSSRGDPPCTLFA
jgi:hypothetical protein